MYKRALTCYENAMRCVQDDATTYNNYALCLDEMGLEVLVREPGRIETWGLRGNLLNEMGLVKESLESYSRALNLEH